MLLDSKTSSSDGSIMPRGTSVCVISHEKQVTGKRVFHVTCAASLRYLYLRHPLVIEMEYSKANPAPTNLLSSALRIRQSPNNGRASVPVYYLHKHFSSNCTYFSENCLFSFNFFFIYIYPMSINHHGPGSAISYIPFKLYDTTTIAPSRAVGKSTSGSVVLTVPCMHVRSCVWRRSDWFAFWNVAGRL